MNQGNWNTISTLLPFHEEIEENENTDKFAKEAAKGLLLDLIAAVVCKKGRTKERPPTGRTCQDKRNRNIVLSFRKEDGLLAGVLIGHAGLKYHPYKPGKDLETVEH